MSKVLLITGGAGFIGSHVVEHFAEKYSDYQIIVMDSITYAADEEFFKGLEEKYPNVLTLRQDITDPKVCDDIFRDLNVNNVIHLAAESHVDNSIENPMEFVYTNIIGTVNLLNAAKKSWGKWGNNNVFYHISTDEVYGHLELDSPAFTEETSYDPRSPYSASKASSDHFVRSYFNTYGLPILISNCSNNYGERQHIEKLLPKAITNLLNGVKIPVYGSGDNIRDWLYVKDHVEAIDLIFHKGVHGETYNIGGDSEVTNLNIVKRLIDIHVKDTKNIQYKHNDSKYFNHYLFVGDRKGHDFRYAINHDKLTRELGWKPSKNLQEGLEITYKYYKNLLK